MTPVPAHLEVRLYLLRALVHPKVLRRVIRQPHAHSEVLGLLDLDPERFEEPGEYKRLRPELKVRLEKLEARWQRRGRDDLGLVLSDLQSRVGLSLVDSAALRLGVRLHQYSEFLEGVNTLTPGPTGRTRLLAQVLQCKLDDAEAVLQPGSVLRRAGWLDAPGLHDGLGETMRLAWNVAEALGARKSRWEDVLAGHCRLLPLGAPEGCRWPHLKLLVRTLSDLLHATLRSGRAGVNVLVHAPSSAAGKTELVRAVAHQAEVIIYEIPGCNADGSPLQAIERLHRLADCQRLFGNMAHALLIDDVDDAFPVASGEDRRPSLKWLHELLERNARPVFWVMRDASRLPRSVLDRFAFVVCLPSASDLGSPVQDDCRRVGVLPPLGLLDEPKLQAKGYSAEELEQLSKLVEIKLKEFRIDAHREIVYLSEILRSKEYERMASPLALALGKDIGGKPIVVDIQKMPHLLVAGTTGSGKSVALNAMILSLLYKASAQDVRMIMIDSKMLELSVYNGIPHLLAPVVTDMKEAANALRWCVAEMERRDKLMAAVGVRNLGGFNRKVKDAIEAGQQMVDPLFNLGKAAEGDKAQDLEPLPYIVVVIDEFADMIVGNKVEELIVRLAQKAHAAGVHLILATQRPSVDVITGLIKANFPTRIAFQLSSKFDSGTVLDQSGAETLLGHGDMLYLPPGTATPERVHGAFVHAHEVHGVVAYLKHHHGRPNYIDNLLEDVQDLSDGRVIGEGALPESSGGEADALYDQAVRAVTETRKASISMVQRRLKIGYQRAARMIEEMEQAGIVTAPNHQGNREVLATPVTGEHADTASVCA